jgi:hypothetical protein
VRCILLVWVGFAEGRLDRRLDGGDKAPKHPVTKESGSRWLQVRLTHDEPIPRLCAEEAPVSSSVGRSPNLGKFQIACREGCRRPLSDVGPRTSSDPAFREKLQRSLREKPIRPLGDFALERRVRRGGLWPVLTCGLWRVGHGLRTKLHYKAAPWRGTAVSAAWPTSFLC